MGRLILIRHTSVAIESGVCYGQSDVPLSQSFAEEAQAVKAKLTELLALDSPTIYSSPLSRCIRLASYCGSSAPKLDTRLLELNFGAWELKAWDAIDDPDLQTWYDNYIYVAPTRGESFAEQCQRVASFLDEVWRSTLGAKSDTLVFTHAGVLRAAMVWAGHYTLEKAFDYDCAYGAIEILTKNHTYK